MFVPFLFLIFVILPRFDAQVQYRLCTYSDISYAKCMRTVELTLNSSALPLQCLHKQTLADCLVSVRNLKADLIVVMDENYNMARQYGLQPVIFERDSDDSLYIAVAPRDITLVQLQEASILVNRLDERAFHAAVFFNMQRGHTICPTFNAARVSATIQIVDAAQYTPKPDEILICPDRSYAEAADFKSCNIEAGLQRAVFMRFRTPPTVIRDVKERIFDTILERFNGNVSSMMDAQFNFFATFDGTDDVIFKNNTIAFDLRPTYRNAINENVFRRLHCNSDDEGHDFPEQLA